MSEESRIYQDILDAADVADSLPNIVGKYIRTSDPSIKYNCLVYAVRVEWGWFEPPNHLPGYYWPPGIDPEWNDRTVKQVLARFGYNEISDSPEPEDGYDKIAIYGDKDGPTHFARQLPNGNWSSKLGELIDVEHTTLECLVGDDHYGNLLYYAKRKSIQR